MVKVLGETKEFDLGRGRYQLCLTDKEGKSVETDEPRAGSISTVTGSLSPFQETKLSDLDRSKEEKTDCVRGSYSIDRTKL